MIKSINLTAIINSVNLSEVDKIKTFLLIEVYLEFKRSNISVINFSKAIDMNRSTVNQMLRINIGRFTLDKVINYYESSSLIFKQLKSVKNFNNQILDRIVKNS